MIALATVAGCGGEGDDSSSTAASQARQAQAEASAELAVQNEAVQKAYEERKEADAPTPEEQEAKQTAVDFYSILDEDEAAKNPNRTEVDSEAFCELMSERAQAQAAHYASLASRDQREWDCESAVDLLVLRSKRGGAFERLRGAEVIGVNARGEKATATVRLGDGPATSVPLVKEDGEWRLAATVPVAP